MVLISLQYSMLSAMFSCIGNLFLSPEENEDRTRLYFLACYRDVSMMSYNRSQLSSKWSELFNLMVID